MDHQLLDLWKQSPVTQMFLDLLREHRDAGIQAILNTSWEAERIGCLNQLKGQVNTLDMVLNLDSFFEEKIEKKRREEDE